MSAHTRLGRMLLWSSLALLIVAISACAAGAAGYAWFTSRHHDQIFPGVFVTAADLSGQSYLTALDSIDSQAAALAETGVTVRYTPPSGDSVDIVIPSVLKPSDAGGDDRIVFTIDSAATIDAAYAIGRSGQPLTDARTRLTTWHYGRSVALQYTIDSDIIHDLLESALSDYANPAVDADFTIKNGQVELIDEAIGTNFDYDAIDQAIRSAISSLDSQPVIAAQITSYPEVTIDDIREQADTITQVLSLAPITLTFEDHSWELSADQLGQLLGFGHQQVKVTAKKLEQHLSQDVTNVLIRPVQEARWKVDTDDDGVLTGISELTPAHNGRDIDYAATAATLTTAITANSPHPSIAVAVIETKPAVTVDTVADLQIHDLLGTGYSNMAGSPSNRRANVARGVELLNGLLIPPDTTFSLLDALKPFSLDNGYLSELVIKGNETTPEIGGGLCQVGSTMFRAAMNSGMDIVERRNHSYDVSYYRDPRNGAPGTDATIYDPAPDFKFYNDTEHYLLLQTRVDNTNELYFDVWGANDGRNASYSEPVAYDWVQPPPLKEVETTDLAPGERNCTESAHAGVTAEFTYTVNYSDGSTHEESFRSVYKPWQAVCLVGKQPDPAPAAEATPETTTQTTKKTPKKST